MLRIEPNVFTNKTNLYDVLNDIIKKGYIPCDCNIIQRQFSAIHEFVFLKKRDDFTCDEKFKYSRIMEFYEVIQKEPISLIDISTNNKKEKYTVSFLVNKID